MKSCSLTSPSDKHTMMVGDSTEIYSETSKTTHGGLVASGASYPAKRTTGVADNHTASAIITKTHISITTTIFVPYQRAFKTTSITSGSAKLDKRGTTTQAGPPLQFSATGMSPLGTPSPCPGNNTSWQCIGTYSYDPATLDPVGIASPVST